MNAGRAQPPPVSSPLARAIARYSMQSPRPSGSGAIAVFQVAGDVSGILRGLGVADVTPGRFGLRPVPNVDTLLVARLSPAHALLFPHAGQAVAARVRAALERAGAVAAEPSTPEEIYPEAASPLEARMLDALARAASPRAIDLLLDQPRRWNGAASPHSPLGELPPAESAILRRLIQPPVVVALGPPNVGKSSLLNALAGRGVAIVADGPGTTRDHVGATIELAGLVVHYLDTPGLTPGCTSDATDPIQHEAQRLALAAAAAADLILSCGDAASGFLPGSALPPGVPALRVALRADLGPPADADEPTAISVSVRQNRGVETLVRDARERLVPANLLADNRAWTFWTSDVSGA